MSATNSTPKKNDSKTRITEKRGMDGLLYIPPILFLLVLFHMFMIINGDGELLRSPDYNQLLQQYPKLDSLIIFEAVSSIGLFIFTIVAGVCFFRKKRQTPKMIITWISLVVAYSIIDVIAGIMIFEKTLQKLEELIGNTSVITYIVIALYLIPYMIFSKRVKNTFVR